MNCPKCGAQMFSEPSVHHQSNATYRLDASDMNTACPSVHCLMCGTYLDQVILNNRARQSNERMLTREAEEIAPPSVLEQVAA